MIVVKLRGGLGNQLFQYAFGRALSISRGVSLYFDISELGNICEVTPRKYALAPFCFPAEIATEEMVTRVITGRGKLEARLRARMPLRWRRVVGEQKEGFDQEFLKVGSTVLLSGYWQDERYFSSYGFQIRRDILHYCAFSKPVEELAQTIIPENAVSIHIRRGDYESDPVAAKRHGTISKCYYMNALSRIQEIIPSPRYYVFSDSIEWAKNNMAFDFPAIFVSNAFGQQDHEDLWLMSRCRHHIIANSTFSWWGAWLGEQKDSVIVYPTRWFVNPIFENEGPAPGRWVKV